MPETNPEPQNAVSLITSRKSYGMAAHDMSATRFEHASMEHLFILITMGDLIGVPILPPYYSLRLLRMSSRTSHLEAAHVA
jgi:hypothetical protein